MIGKQLRAWREGMDWSQDQAAMAFGRTRRSYQEMENSTGHIDPNITARLPVLDFAAVLLQEGKTALDVVPELRTVVGGAMDAIAQVNNMPKPGRPKKDARGAALEDLYDAARQHRGVFANRAQGMNDAVFQRALVDMINLTDAVTVAKSGPSE